mmetsp:Transcript_133771/g.286086  ORF Transcript_133771/g.286086 Transcript_133771/m.286086 type:complete len:393 (+) Transcript_133771:114-1292(+)
MARSAPTFLVSSEEQHELLDQFKRRCLHFTEAYSKHKPLCFTARAYQRSHPDKVLRGEEDADATLASPMLLGVCDGVSQVDNLGLKPSELPQELLRSCEDIASAQLFAGTAKSSLEDAYSGPIQLLKEAYADTESHGSTSVLLAVMDNSSQVHGKLHPMIGVVTLGDCELVILRRTDDRDACGSPLQVILHTEKQRIGGHSQTPLQLARLDESMYGFDEDEALEAIEQGSGLHCMSTYEGDILILGSDGVFDNLFLSEVIEICNQKLPPRQNKETFLPAQSSVLHDIARCIVEKALAKSEIHSDRPLAMTPLGAGGKVDDTSVVVAQVVEWTQARNDAWTRARRRRTPWGRLLAWMWPIRTTACGAIGDCGSDSDEASDSGEEQDARECIIS